MNEILQKRIEEAAQKELEDTLEVTMSCQCANIAYEEFLQGVKYALSNQWISVEEALPDMIDEDMEWSDIVLIKCKYCEDMKPCIITSRYDVGTGFWLNPVAREITHWMSIPQLK